MQIDNLPNRLIDALSNQVGTAARNVLELQIIQSDLINEIDRLTKQVAAQSERIISDATLIKEIRAERDKYAIELERHLRK